MKHTKVNLIKATAVAAAILLFINCTSPGAKSIRLTDDLVSKPENCTLVVYGQGAPIPDGAKAIGTVLVRDFTGLSINCGFSDVLSLAKKEACKLGADGLEILMIEKPSIWNSCYQITASALRFDQEEVQEQESNPQ